MTYKQKTRKKVHTEKFDRCVRKVKRKGTAQNPYAVCTKSLGKEAFLKHNGRKTLAGHYVREFNPEAKRY